MSAYEMRSNFGPLHVLTGNQVRDALEDVLQKFTVVAPVMADNKLVYDEVNDVSDIVLNDALPYKSPKDVVFPRVEDVMRFLENRVEEAQVIKPVLLVGAKPCDLAAMKVLDEVFTGEQGRYKDSFYSNRRDFLIIVGMNCREKKSGCFCEERGINPAFSQDCDGFLTLQDDGAVYEPLTEKGADLFSGATAASENSVSPGEETLVLNTSEAEVFTAMPWEKYAEGCIGCGTCTFICPTCHCFNLRDSEKKGIVTRTRVWDSCMYPKFTLHAGGHNPRTRKYERFRQRVLHKYLYIPENYGCTACTGCGRCIRSCPGGLNIRNTVLDIQRRLAEKREVHV
ncbi:MAG: 4Fe-4S ferredoxin iron-sulfur binding domain protein [Bacillota bacterium]|nr:4Fe-4S ferredoxin iron-sulfur binding domain protein [Bacillota bacterium]